MRIACLLCLVSAALSGGCAGMIARTGIDPTELKTKEEVRARFGEPTVIGSLDGTDGAFYEDYFTHRKIATHPDRTSSPGYVMGLFMTLGTLDLFLVPEELLLTAKRTVVGQTLRFTYDKNEKLLKLELDGDTDEFGGFYLSQKVLRDPSLFPVNPDSSP
jgi:hypothetical protein